MTKIIGRIAATEGRPTTIDELIFWTNPEERLAAFDIVKVAHVNGSYTFAAIEEMSHISDSPGYLNNYVSNDFGSLTSSPPTERLSLYYVKAKVIHNTKSIYTPVHNNATVELASQEEISIALGVNSVKHPVFCGFVSMYEGENRVTLPVSFSEDFLVGPEGAHLNISGISGLAAKTSYAMFLLKNLQQKFSAPNQTSSIAFVMFNVKGRDLLRLNEFNDNLTKKEFSEYQDLFGFEPSAFNEVTYYYPFDNSERNGIASYILDTTLEAQRVNQAAKVFKYTYEEDKNNIGLLLANVEDQTGTMESIINTIIAGQDGFGDISDWGSFREKVEVLSSAGGGSNQITVQSWRKFGRVLRSALKQKMFHDNIDEEQGETRLGEALSTIKNGEVRVIDIAKLDTDTQAFVFGDVINRLYDLKLGDSRDGSVPKTIVIFVDELNKYASTDVPKSSAILKQILDIAERGRSLGIILFSAEQFKSAIHDRVKGNCSTHAYGRTNAIEISKSDYRFVPTVYKNMLTRLSQGEYIVQHPIFRNLIKINFPKPTYKQSDE